MNVSVTSAAGTIYYGFISEPRLKFFYGWEVIDCCCLVEWVINDDVFLCGVVSHFLSAFLPTFIPTLLSVLR